MTKKYALVFVAFLCAAVSGYGQGLEDFTNSNATSSYSDDSFVGNNGVTWTYVASRDGNGDSNGSGISLPALMLRRSSDNSKITSSTITGGLGDFSVKLYKGFTGSGNRQVELFVNNVSQGSSTPFNDYNEHFFTINSINISGNIVIEIRNITGQQVIIDDISWTLYSGGGCSIAASGVSNISCNDNATSGDTSDDYITFDLDPIGSTLGTNYNVSVSSGSVTPNSAAYGSVTTFTLQNGSAGASDVTVTITDDTDGTCSLDQLISDPGSCATGSCTELMISEYVEGSSSNKYIEIYNPTASSVNLNNYRVAIYSNGSATVSGFFNLTGTLASFDTYVIENSSATIYGGTANATNNTVTGFNGNDAIALQTSGGTNIDVIGEIGNNAMFGEDITLRRKSTVQNPNLSYTISEWDSFAQNDIELGTHTNDCEGPTPELQLTNTTPTDQPCGFTLNAGSAETNVSTNDVSFYITNVGSADLEITDLNLPVGDYSILAPATLPTVGSPIILAPFGGSQLVTIRFAPTVDGTVTNTLTITSNDANEGTCSVNLTGEGFTPAPNIVVRGLVGSNPTIANGSGMGSVTFLNNTEFSAQTINAGSQTKGFRIDNGSGTAPLTVNSITLTGDNADFYVTANLTNPIAAGDELDFTMTFAPTSNSGDRFALVTVSSSDPNKPTYTFYIKGTANCPSVTGAISPTEGPIDTEVTITSSNDLTGATATLNGIPLNVISNSSTELVVSIPDTATIGGSISVLLSNGCVFSSPFTLIDKTISGCQDGNGTVDDLFISQVTDSPTGSLTYVELYNATGATIDFSATNYILKVYNNGKTTTPSNFIITINSGIVVNNSTFIIAMGTADSQCTGVTGADGNPNDLEITTIGVSINFFYKDSSNVEHLDRGHDYIGLYDASDTPIDAFGIFGDETWATSLGLGKSGANFERKTSALIPEPNFSTSDWNIVDWTDCTEVDYSGIGDYDYSVGLPPLSSDLNVSAACNTATITVIGTEGYTEIDDAHDLTYQWFYFDPTDATLPEWKPISAGGIYTLSAAGDVLSISDTSSILDYQYYCQVRESGATCYQASNAVKIVIPSTTWTNVGWTTPPTSSKIAIIDYPYNTNTNDSFEACSLIINAGYTLTISNSKYVNVINNVTNYGTIDIQTQGSFVQQGDGTAAGTFTNSGAGIANVAKTTATFDSTVSTINYTYWSSPINDPNNLGFGEDISTVFPTPVGNRRYYFEAANFLDKEIEVGNNNDVTNGQDDIDDNGDDWQVASGAMEIGRGYAVTTSAPPPMPGNYSDNSTVFSGALNTGDITVTLYKNNNEVDDNNWNFIGNPYPSAIDVDLFFNANIADVPLNPPIGGEIEGAIFLWSQSIAPDANNNGNENVNFAQSDYAIINRTASTAGTSGEVPSRYIPSGQGFFVALTENLSAPVNSVTSANIVFTNSMRSTGNNTQFFEANDSSHDLKTTDTNYVFEKNILWLNLTSDNGVFSQIAVAYTNGATDGYDGWSYDTPRNLSTGTYATLYSIIDSSVRQFAIQGKSPQSLNLNEIIPIGFDTTINEATLYKFSIAQLEGSFMNQNDVFIKDNLLNKIHNLKESDYSFTSEVGEFKDRFEIVFTRETLNIGEVKVDNNAFQIIELPNGDVQFKVSSQFEIKSIKIVDLLGRTLHKLNAEGNSQTFALSNLSQAPYLAKVELTNGYIITKKALKRK